MQLSEIAIRRPVFTTMVTVGLMVLGLASLGRLGVDLFPDISFPVVTVTTPWPGAGPAEVETLVTRPLEEAIFSLNGVDEITSYSRDGVSMLVVTYRLEVDIQQAAIEVRERVSSIRNALPRDIRDPTITRVDPNAAPVVTYAVATDLDPLRTRQLVEDVVKQMLERQQGVGGVTIKGGREREIRVLLDAAKLEALGLSVSQISQSLAAEGSDMPGGRITGEREITLRTEGRFKSMEDLGAVVLLSRDGTQVRLRDVAEVQDGLKEVRTTNRVDGREAVAFDVVKQSGANTVSVCDAVYEVVEAAQAKLPAGTRLVKLTDSSSFIRSNIADVKESILFGGAMAILVIFLFMLDWRSTLISALALPTSVVATFFAMNLLGFSLNMMSLMGLSLAIGLLIDDSVVVRENIFRHMEQGEDPFTAARKGTAEIALAVMATTFTVVAVFVPIAFMEGMIGKMFREFGLTVVAAVMVSLFVSFTLDPMLSARLVKKIERHDQAERRHPVLGLINRGYDALDGFYRDVIAWALSGTFPKLLITGGSALLLVVALAVAGKFMGTEFMPQTDKSEFAVSVELPPGTPLARTGEAVAAMEAALKRDPMIVTTYATIGVNEEVHKATITVKTVAKEDRSEPLDLIGARARTALEGWPGAKTSVILSSAEGQMKAALQLVLTGPDLDVLARLADEATAVVAGTQGVVDASSSLAEGKPEYRLVVDRQALGYLWLSAVQVAACVRSAVDGDLAARYLDGEKDYDVRVQLRPEDRSEKALLERLTFPSKKGRLVMLREVAQVESTTSPATIERFNRERRVVISGNLDGRTLGQVVKDLTPKLEAMKLPDGYGYRFAGQTKSMREAMSGLVMALALAIIFIYLVLASQFESFVHPATIMVSMPLAVVGALLALFLTGKALGMFAMIGIVLLMGLVTKNAILLIDYTNQLREQGMGMKEALLAAGPTRLRPILMTSAAMVLGMLPPALSDAAGSEMRSPMAISVIAGVITSTLLTLVVVPVAYTWIDRFTLKKSRPLGGDETAGQGQSEGGSMARSA